MSTPEEATLSAAERAALAGLETKAEADDPRLAAALRGSGRPGPKFKVPPALVRASHTWLGPVLAIIGLAAMVVALSSAVVIAVLGGAVLVIGILLSVGLVKAKLGPDDPPSPGREPHDKGHDEGPLSNV